MIENQLFLRTSNLRAIDFDGDGDLDLAMAAINFGEFRLYENRGGGAFGARIDVGASSSFFEDLEPFDVDFDGDLDLIAATQLNASLRWIENLGGFQFVDRGPFLNSGGLGVLDLDSADVDGDGLPDLILIDRDNTVAWVPGAPTGFAFQLDAQGVQRPVQGAVESAVLDVDLDGISDVVTASPDGGIYLARGLGGDRFTLPERVVPLVQAADSMRAVDLDQNGTEDLLFGTPEGGAWWVAIDMAGALGLPQRIGSAAALLAVAPEAIDFDGDGDLDVLLAGDNSSNVIVHEQLSAGSFAPGRPLISGTGDIAGLIAEDFDGDGTLDLIAVDQRSPGAFFELYTGLGSGAFAAPTTAASSSGVLGLGARDLNGDGAPDLAWVRSGARVIQRAMNTGAGTFGAVEDLGTFADQPDAIHAGPAGPSGEATLVVYHRRIGRTLGVLEWFAIDGPMAISLQQMEVRLDEVASLSLDDINGDGDLDVLVAAPKQGRVGWFENTAIGELGARECSPAVANSLGLPARLRVSGSGTSALDELRLQALDLPRAATTLFLASPQAGLVVGSGGSQGTLCLGDPIGRFDGPGQVAIASVSGLAGLSIDLQALPQPTGSVAAMSGETWRFQAWYRDTLAGSATSNFTDSVAILIQ